MLQSLKKIYRKHIHFQFLDKFIYKILIFFTDVTSFFKQFYFPEKYIRQWKWDMFFQRYERDTVSVFNKIIKPCMVVVDIGAHIGYFTRFFSQLTGKSGVVYAFEADPYNFSLLRRNTKHLKNVRLFELAITDKVGEIDFYQSQEKTGCHSTIPAVFRQQKITVKSMDLDTALEMEGVKCVDVIKMDIEGGEFTALKGMKKMLSDNPQIMIITELNPQCLQMAGIGADAFLNMFTSWGFEIFFIMPSELRLYSGSNLAEVLLSLNSEFVNILCRRAG